MEQIKEALVTQLKYHAIYFGSNSIFLVQRQIYNKHDMKIKF